jgi:Sec-independent protein translocase protein TatA
MEILGVGPLEFLLILIIALIVLGPNDMVKAGRMLGSGLRRIMTSPVWRTIQQVSQEIRGLPNTLMRDAGIEEIQKEIKDSLPTNEEILVDTGLDEINKDVNRIRKSIGGLPTPISGPPKSSVAVKPASSPTAPSTQSSVSKPAPKDAYDWSTAPAVPSTASAVPSTASAVPNTPPAVQNAAAASEQATPSEQVSSGVQTASVPPDQLSSPEEPLQI